MATFFQYGWDALCWIFVVFGMAIVPAALFLYLMIAYGGRFFSPKGRFSRLAFLEGISSWVLLNSFTSMFVIMYMMYSASFLARTLDDTDATIYTNLFIILFFLLWVFAMVTMMPLCAKRWHDLNLPGWLSAINAAPIFVSGLTLLVFFNGVGREMFRKLILDSNALGSGQNVFLLVGQARTLFIKEYVSTSPMYACFTAAVMAGAFFYLGLAEGVNTGSASRKKSVNVSPRPGRV